MRIADAHAIATDRLENRAREAVQADPPPFEPRLPWLGGDLQTVRNHVRSMVADIERDLREFERTRGEIPLNDGTGDRLAIAVNMPSGRFEDAPVLILIHGLTGCESSVYMIDAAAEALRRGFVVVRMNLRGGGFSSPLCRGHYHAGRTRDLELALPGVLAFLSSLGSRPSRLFAAGFSLGANMLLKFLGEQGRDAPFAAAAAISPPLSLREAAERILRPRNALYQRFLLRRMRAEVLAEPCELSAERRAAANVARTVREFDDRVVAPENGFAGAEDYYRRCGSEAYVGGIRIPTLVVHAEDDPWIPATGMRRIGMLGNPYLRLTLTPRGGHVGFHGRGHSTAWHNIAMASFFAPLVASPFSNWSTAP